MIDFEEDDRYLLFRRNRITEARLVLDYLLDKRDLRNFSVEHLETTFWRSDEYWQEIISAIATETCSDTLMVRIIQKLCESRYTLVFTGENTEGQGFAFDIFFDMLHNVIQPNKSISAIYFYHIIDQIQKQRKGVQKWKLNTESRSVEINCFDIKVAFNCLDIVFSDGGQRISLDPRLLNHPHRLTYLNIDTVCLEFINKFISHSDVIHDRNSFLSLQIHPISTVVIGRNNYLITTSSERLFQCYQRRTSLFEALDIDDASYWHLPSSNVSFDRATFNHSRQETEHWRRGVAEENRRIYQQLRQNIAENIARHNKTQYIGDLNCKYNAKSSFIRCAVNPSGPCEGCLQKDENR
jgi:hypothetical protein